MVVKVVRHIIIILNKNLSLFFSGFLHRQTPDVGLVILLHGNGPLSAGRLALENNEEKTLSHDVCRGILQNIRRQLSIFFKRFWFLNIRETTDKVFKGTRVFFKFSTAFWLWNVQPTRFQKTELFCHFGWSIVAFDFSAFGFFAPVPRAYENLNRARTDSNQSKVEHQKSRLSALTYKLRYCRLFWRYSFQFVVHAGTNPHLSWWQNRE